MDLSTIFVFLCIGAIDPATSLSSTTPPPPSPSTTPPITTTTKTASTPAPTPELTTPFDELMDPVAFHAEQNNPYEGSDTQDTIIVFDSSVWDMGGGYSPASGIFRPTVSGVYSLSYQIQAHNSCEQNYLGFNLVVNGNIKARSFSKPHSGSSNSLTLPLYQGDEVWVAIESTKACLSLEDGCHCNWFSGHLLNQL